MTMRFKVGELAVLAVSLHPEETDDIGKEVIVQEIGPYRTGQVIRHPICGEMGFVVRPGDYLVTFSDEACSCVRDFQLKKMNPPEEPASLRRDETIEEEVTA